MSGIEGQILIDLKCRDAVVERVDVTSTRPVQASRILIGKTAPQVLETIPLLFSICAVAQARAALLGIQQTMQLEIDPARECARDLLVLAENAKEHLLRIQLDWPPLFGHAVDTASLPWLSRLLNEFKKARFVDGRAFALDSELITEASTTAALIDELERYLQQQVFGGSLSQWLAIDSIDALRQWAQDYDSIAALSVREICQHGWTSQGLSECRGLSSLDTHELLQHFNDADAAGFIAAPTWQGECQETTALSRQWSHPLIRLLHDEFDSSLITRWLARLVELAQIPAQMRELLQSNQNKSLIAQAASGIAQVEAARGRLVHRVELDGDVITRYQILAPTEWNFHPQGLVAQSLSRLRGRDEAELETLARLMVNVIDPCVGYELRIG